MIRVNKAHFPVTALGYGRRIGIWLQGCPIHCDGCISADTWEDDPEREIPLDMLLDWCMDISGGELDGVTITGGEPFHQPEALRALLEKLRRWRLEIGITLDILCYSGFDMNHLERRFPAILTLIDAVIPGPFLVNRPNGDSLFGSDNQSVVILSALGKERYAGALFLETCRKQIQASSDSEGLWLIGIPGRGDMDTFRSGCTARGLDIKEVSWNR
ncbi:MAG: 4Fe-4S single cluster domain-containing protein [Desulfuromonadales bacterium]